MLPVSRQHVSLCIQQQTCNKLATIMLPATCWCRQHVACCQQHVASSNTLPATCYRATCCPGVNAALCTLHPTHCAFVRSLNTTLVSTEQFRSSDGRPTCSTFTKVSLKLRQEAVVREHSFSTLLTPIRTHSLWHLHTDVVRDHAV